MKMNKFVRKHIYVCESYKSVALDKSKELKVFTRFESKKTNKVNILVTCSSSNKSPVKQCEANTPHVILQYQVQIFQVHNHVHN